MLSRVADSVHWMNRYIERAENVARFIEVNYNLTLDEADSLSEQWAPLVYTTGDHDLFRDHFGETTRANVLRFLAFDRDNSNSILSCLERARENARTIREVISLPMWEQINKFYHLVRAAASNPGSLEQPHEFCSRVMQASHLLIGCTDATMSHGEAWHFGRMGRLLERADKTSRIVDVQYYLLLPDANIVGSALDVVRWSALLKSASALEMYRRVHGRIVPEQVADFLILNGEFPRSIHFCLKKTHESLRNITGTAAGTFRNDTEKSLGRVTSQLDYTTIADVIHQGMHEFVDDFQSQLNRIGRTMHREFFATTPPEPLQTQSQVQVQR